MLSIFAELRKSVEVLYQLLICFLVDFQEKGLRSWIPDAEQFDRYAWHA